jgi:hypothetical protein
MAAKAPLRSVTSVVVTATAWGKPLRVHGNMSLEAGNLFAGIVSFLFCTVGVLDALRVN